MPARAPIRFPAEYAAVMAVRDQPVLPVMSVARTGERVEQDTVADDLGEAQGRQGTVPGGTTGTVPSVSLLTGYARAAPEPAGIRSGAGAQHPPLTAGSVSASPGRLQTPVSGSTRSTRAAASWSPASSAATLRTCS